LRLQGVLPQPGQIRMGSCAFLPQMNKLARSLRRGALGGAGALVCGDRFDPG
jgi:hypothetical protein